MICYFTGCNICYKKPAGWTKSVLSIAILCTLGIDGQHFQNYCFYITNPSASMLLHCFVCI